MWIQRTQSAMDAAQAAAQKAADDKAWEEKKLRQEKRWLARQVHYFRTGRWDWHKHWQIVPIEDRSPELSAKLTRRADDFRPK